MREYSSAYVEAIRFSSIAGGTGYATLIEPSGVTRHCWNSGMIARVDYPEAFGAIDASTASEHLRQIQSLLASYPQWKMQLQGALVKWKNALYLASQTKPAPQPVPTVHGEELASLEVDGTKYEGVTLTGTDADSASITHSEGVATIKLDSLTQTQIAALNATTSSYRIDPAWKEKLKAAQEPAQNGTVPTTPSATDSPSADEQTDENVDLLVRAKSWNYSGMSPKERQSHVEEIYEEFSKIKKLYGDYHAIVIQRKLDPEDFGFPDSFRGRLYQAVFRGDEEQSLFLVTSTTEFESPGEAVIFGTINTPMNVEMNNGFSKDVPVLLEALPVPDMDNRIQALQGLFSKLQPTTQNAPISQQQVNASSNNGGRVMPGYAPAARGRDSKPALAPNSPPGSWMWQNTGNPLDRPAY